MDAVVSFEVNGRSVEVPAGSTSLLEALRDRLALRGAKDGCSPQGQCGCCTVWVDGQPRVACVTPVARVAGRSVTTIEGLSEASRWAEALCASGGSQCGSCTPGIVMRLAGLDRFDRASVDQALLAHLCRCTGWQSIHEGVERLGLAVPDRDLERAGRRASLEGGAIQRVGPEVSLGRGGFADDSAPPDALVAVRDGAGQWQVAETLSQARALAGKVPGRRTTVPVSWPIDVPVGTWVRTLQTTWVEPAYLELDCSWCEPGGEPASPLGNGGAFGGKATSEVRAVARRLADQYGRVVRVAFSREDAVRLGPKRPPLAAGLRADGSGVVRVARTAGIAAAIASLAPGLEVEELEVAGPPTSAAIRAAGWAEAAVLLSSLAVDERSHATDTTFSVTSPAGARASARIGSNGEVSVSVRCGMPLDEVVLRSYCIGAVHQALGWVRSEGLAVNTDGEVQDLTVRSFGILRAVDMAPVDVVIEPDDGPSVNGSDAVFAAVAVAAWHASGFQPRWPVDR